MNQFFEVGERVFANFQHYPENNGEYVIVEVLTKDQFISQQPTFNPQDDLYYRLDGLSIVGRSTGCICDKAAQQALRKLHKPSEFTYDQLMNTLKSPVTTQ